MLVIASVTIFAVLAIAWRLCVNPTLLPNYSQAKEVSRKDAKPRKDRQADDLIVIVSKKVSEDKKTLPGC
jgi:hypothetical protein